MATNFNGLRRTKETLLEIEKRAKALKLDDGVTPAFQTVELFDAVDFDAALEAFIAARDRVCVIVFDGDRFANEVRGTDATSAQTREVFVMVSDRVIAPHPRKALFGDGGEHPGAMTLADIVKEQMSGVLFENPKGCFLRPTGTEPLVVKKEKQPGRRGQVVSFEVRGGLLSKDLGKSPIQ